MEEVMQVRVQECLETGRLEQNTGVEQAGEKGGKERGDGRPEWEDGVGFKKANLIFLSCIIRLP